MRRLAALLCATTALCAAPLAARATTPSFDLASDNHANFGSGVGTGSTTVTTAAANEVVVAQIISQGNTLARTVNSVTASGLTFTHQISCAVTGTNGVKLNEEIWTAPAASTQSANPITYTLSGTGAGEPDSSSIFVIGVENAYNVNAPLDSNALAASCGTIVAGAATAALTTSQAHDLLTAWGMHTYGSFTYTASAWGVNGPIGNASGAQNNMAFAQSYDQVSVTQSAVNVDLTTAETVNPSVLIGLAFTGDNNAAASPKVNPLLFGLDYHPTRDAPRLTRTGWAWGSSPSGGASTTINFGQSLTGYGGEQASDLGLTGTLSIVSLGGTCNSADLVIDGNGMLSPNNAARNWNGQASGSTGYGSASAILAYTDSRTCPLVLHDSNGNHSLTVSFAAHTKYWRAMTGTTYNPDSSSDQMDLMLQVASSDATGRNSLLGDVLYGRDGLIFPNTKNVGGVNIPSGGYASGTGSQVTVKCEHETSTQEADGRFYTIGSCGIGSPYEIDATAFGDHVLPVTWQHLLWYNNYAGETGAFDFVTTGGNAHGFTIDGGSASFGPAVIDWLDTSFIRWTYSGSDTAAETSGGGCNAKNIYIAHMGGGFYCSMTGSTLPFALLTSNLGYQLAGDFIDRMPLADDESNSFIQPITLGGGHNDSEQIFGSSTGASGLTSTSKFNIEYGDVSATPSGLGGATITSGTCSGCTSGTYGNNAVGQLPAVVVYNSRGDYGTVDQIVVSGGVVTSVGFAGDDPGLGWQVGDTIIIPPCTSRLWASTCPGNGITGVVLTVSSLKGTGGAQGWPFDGSPGTDTYVCDYENDVVVDSFGNASAPNNCKAGSVLSNYTALDDIQANINGSHSGIGLAVNDTDMANGAITLNGDVTNRISVLGSGAGSPIAACTPGTPQACAAGQQTVGLTLGAIQTYYPNWNTQTQNAALRSVMLSMLTPASGFEVQGAVTPPDVNGQRCWAKSSATWNASQSCAQMGLVPAN